MLFHLHLFAAIAWIGGSVFLFVLGVSIRNKMDQKKVYPIIGPIFGYFEIVMLIVLVTTGIGMIVNNGLIQSLFDTTLHHEVINSLRIKLLLVVFIVFLTIIHTYIAFKTIHKERTPRENFFSRGASMLIFILNLVVLHYAITIRDIL
ncbi:MAG: hypothetical protein KU28_04485 [Sulfurovum sp. PC08-66]|jgi:putative copper export protein|nr:MAG: hypothetical protein KU28_04485 [Sulfurovum sp. PC08-66]